MAGNTNIGTLVVELLFKDDAFGKGIDKSATKLSTFGQQLQSAAGRVDQFLTAAFKRATLAAAAFSAAVVVTGATFEKTMSEVASKTQATAEELQRMTDKAREIGATTAYSATEAAEAMVLLGQAGFSVNEIIDSTQAIMYLAGANATDLATAAAIAAAAIRVFGLDASEAGRVSDVFTSATNASQLTLEDLGTAMRYAGPIAKTLGMSIEETTAALASFRDLGLTGQQTGTNFRSMMEGLVNPTRMAILTLKEMNLTVADVDPVVHGFGEVVRTLGEHGLTATKAFQIFGQVSGGAVSNLVQATQDGRSSFEDMSAVIELSSGAAGKAYTTMLDNVWGRWKIFTSAITELTLVLYDSVKGPIGRLLEELTHRVDVLAMMFGVTADGATTAMDAIVDGILKIVDTIISFLPYLDDIAVAMAFAWIGAKGISWGIAIAQLVQGVLALTASAGGLVAGLRVLAVTLVTTTGGIGALVFAVGALIAVFTTLLPMVRQSRIEQERLNGALDASRAFSAMQADEAGRVAEALGHMKDAALAQLQADAQRADGEERLTALQRAHIQQILDLTDAQAAQGIAEGRLILNNGYLIDTQEAMANGDKQGTAMVENKIGQIDRENEARKAVIKTLDEALKYNGDLSKMDALQVGSMNAAREAVQNYEKAKGNGAQLLGREIVSVKDLQEAQALLTLRVKEQTSVRSGLVSKMGQSVIANENAAAAEADLADEHEVGLRESMMAADGAKTAEGAISKLAATVRETTAALQAQNVPDAVFLDPTKSMKEVLMVEAQAGRVRAALKTIQDTVAGLAGSDMPMDEALQLFLNPDAMAREALRAGRTTDEINTAFETVQAAARDLDDPKKKGAVFIDPDQVRIEGLAAGQSSKEIVAAVDNAENAIANLNAGGITEKDVIPSDAINAFYEKGRIAGLTWMQRLQEGIDKGGQKITIGQRIVNGLKIAQGALGALFKYEDDETEKRREDTRGQIDALVGDSIGRIGVVAAEGLGRMAGHIGEMIISIRDGGEGFGDALIGAADAFGQVMSKTLGMLTQGIVGIAQTFATGPIMAVFDKAQGILDIVGLFDAAQGNIDAATQARDEYLDFQNQGAISGDRQGPAYAGEVDPAQIMADTVREMAAGIVTFITGIAEAAPIIVKEILVAIPTILDALIASLPQLFTAIADALPGLVRELVAALPDLIVVIANGIAAIIAQLPAILQAFLSHLPEIITALVDAIPIIIQAFVTALPGIIEAIITNIPAIIIALIKAIPTIIVAVVQALPTIILEVLKAVPMLIGEIIMALPQILIEVLAAVGEVMASIGTALLDIIKMVGEAFIELVTFGLAKTSLDGKKTNDGKKTSADFFGEVFSLGFKNTDYDHEGEQRSFSGIEYVPYTMRSILEPGEAVLDAHTNAQRLRGRGDFPTPSMPPAGGGVPMQPQEIVVQINDRVLDVALVDGAARGRMPGVRRLVRNNDGARVGVSRGRTNMWGGG